MNQRIVRRAPRAASARRTLDLSARLLALGLIATLAACTTSAGEGPPATQEASESEILVLTSEHRLQAPQPRPFEQFGAEVALSERYAVVGAVGSQAGTALGRAYVFDRASAAGAPAVLSDAEGSPGALFGNAVAVSGETIAVGAPFDAQEGDRAGAVFVFERQGGEWLRSAKITPEDSQPLAYFGQALGLEGDRLAVGAAGPSGQAVYLFERAGSSWSEVAALRPSEVDSQARFGSTIDLDGDRLAVGAWTTSADDPGRVYLFSVLDGDWVQEWVARSGDLEDRFGYDIDLRGDRMAVSSLGGMLPASVRVFELSAGGWTFSSLVSPEQGLLGFGSSLALGPGILFVGAPTTTVASSGAGTVLAYELLDGKWNRTAVFNSSEQASDEEFGSALAVDGSTVLVGAPGAMAGAGGSPVGAVFLFDYGEDAARGDGL